MVVAHAGSIRAILCRLLGVPLEEAFGFEVDYARVTALTLWGSVAQPDLPQCRVLAGPSAQRSHPLSAAAPARPPTLERRARTMTTAATNDPAINRSPGANSPVRSRTLPIR